MSLSTAITAIRNANSRGIGVVEVPKTRLVSAVCECLRRNGYVWSAEGDERKIRVTLKFGADGVPLVRGMRLLSVPSRRQYLRKRDVKPVLSGVGCMLISTSEGIMTDVEARKRGLGGEALIELT